MAEMELEVMRKALGSLPYSATNLYVLSVVNFLHRCFFICYIGKGGVALNLSSSILVE